jgi:vitamin B12 transporter
MNKLFVVIVCLLSAWIAKGQSLNDSVALESVTVTSSRFSQFNTGSKTVSTDSVLSIAYKTQTLADLLASQSQVFIKSYGQGIATASFRGSSTEQTAVLWKGFNLQNPMLGQVDFSLVAGDIADNIAIQYGGNGALFGSGAVGGTIQLLSSAKYNSKLHANIGVQVGSFGHLREQVGLSYGSKKWFSTVKYFHLDAKNNFTYTNTFLADKPEVEQTNAAVFQQGFINENYFQLTPKQELNVNVWLQQTDKQIPPSMSVPQALTNQKDETYRATAEWKYKLKRVIWMARNAYFDESINYVNPVSSLLGGNSRSRTSISEVESRIRFNTNHSVNIGVNNTFISAFADGYGGTFNQNRLALFVSYKTEQLIKNVNTTLSVRQELVKEIFTPVMPSFGAEWNAKKWLRIFGNVSRSYRLPTFNETYWKSVTTNVKPESGWGEELNVQTRLNYNRVTINATLGAFNRNIKNWIIWQPASIDWAPQNLKQVWSRGAEFDGKISYALNKCTISYHFMVNYVLSTNSQSNVPNDETIGKQLLYVPRVTQQHQLLAAFKTWHIALLQNYVGLRFTTTDNSDWLSAYSPTTFMAGKQFNINRFALVISVQVNNVLNNEYQAVADRPMPGRNFLINTNFKF